MFLVTVQLLVHHQYDGGMCMTLHSHNTVNKLCPIYIQNAAFIHILNGFPEVFKKTTHFLNCIIFIS